MTLELNKNQKAAVELLAKKHSRGDPNVKGDLVSVGYLSMVKTLNGLKKNEPGPYHYKMAEGSMLHYLRSFEWAKKEVPFVVWNEKSEELPEEIQELIDLRTQNNLTNSCIARKLNLDIDRAVIIGKALDQYIEETRTLFECENTKI